MDTIEWIKAHWGELGAVALALYVFLRVLVLLTPTKADDEALDRFTLFVAGVAKVLGLKSPVVPAAPEPPAAPPREENKKAGRVRVELLLVLAVLLALAGCRSAGDQYQASALAFVAACDAATELRAAGKLDEKEVAAIGIAIDEGHAVLHAWGEALKAGQDYPDGHVVMDSVVRGIVAHVQRKGQ